MDIDLNSVFEDEDFAALGEEQRKRVLRLLYALRSAPADMKVTGAGGLLYRLAAAAPCSYGLARKMWYAYAKTGDWRELYDHRTTPAIALTQNRRLRALLAEQVQLFAEAHQRSTAQAIHDVWNLIRAGEMAGFEEWVGLDRLPPGCSETSLRSHIKKGELANKRLGLKSNTREQAQMRLTREGIAPGRIYEFDDVQHDNLVRIGTSRQCAVRVLEFAAQDVSSGYILHHGGCAAVKREDGVQATPGKSGTKQNLNGKMALMFVAYVLRYVGYSAEGVELRLEHATTSLPPRVIALLETCGQGITCRMGGINGWQQKKIAGYEGTPGGNPHNKALKEQQWSTMHNLLDYLPGQVGKDRQHAPEETHGLKKIEQEASRFELALRRKGLHELADALHHPVLNIAQFHAILNQKYAEYNGSCDHQFEGVEIRKRPMYLAGGVWRSEAEITNGAGFTPEEEEFYRAHPHLMTWENMSPAEVWHSVPRARSAKQWRYLPLAVYVEMLKDEKYFGRKATVTGRRITLRDQYISHDELVYDAEMVTPAGRKVTLENGERVRVVLNPVSQAPLVVLDEKGGIMGECPQVLRTSPLDDEMVHEQLGRIRSQNVSAQAAQLARWKKDRELVEARREENLRIAAEGGVRHTRWADMEGPHPRQIAAGSAHEPSPSPRSAKKAAGKAAALPMPWDCTPPANRAPRPKDADAAAALAALPSTSRRYRRPEDI